MRHCPQVGHGSASAARSFAYGALLSLSGPKLMFSHTVPQKRVQCVLFICFPRSYFGSRVRPLSHTLLPFFLKPGGQQFLAGGAQIARPPHRPGVT
eukprot:5467870-Amphidinium_carterae.1